MVAQRSPNMDTNVRANISDKFLESANAQTLQAPLSRPHLTQRGASMKSRIHWYPPPRRSYTRRELLADRIINFTGMALSLIGGPILGVASYRAGDGIREQVCFGALSFGMITMLSCSALYHYFAWMWSKADKMLSMDHVGISAMIVGCYCPPLYLAGCTKVLVFVATLGLLGWLIEALSFTRFARFVKGGGAGSWALMDYIQVVRYLIMGWSILVVMPTVWRALPGVFIGILATGGVLYTAGVVIFLKINLEYHMAIWHFMVLMASICMYSGNFLYLVGFKSTT